MDGMTVYHCPVCNDEMLRVRDPEAPARLVREDAPLGVLIQRTVERGMRQHFTEVDAGLRRAVDEHECRHPLRFRLWRYRHREELAPTS